MPRKSDPKPKARKPTPPPSVETEHLTYKQRMFIEFFLGEAKGNATEAARLAGYACPNVQGSENLAKPSIRAAIDAKLGGVALTTNEILARLSEAATADLIDFCSPTPSGYLKVDIAKAAALGKTHLIKKLKYGQWGPEIELHDSQSALEKLAKYRGILKDRIEVESGDPDPLKSAEAAALLAELERRSKSEGGDHGEEEGEPGG